MYGIHIDIHRFLSCQEQVLKRRLFTAQRRPIQIKMRKNVPKTSFCLPRTSKIHKVDNIEVLLRLGKTQQEQDVVLTLLQCQYEVAKLHGCCNNVRTTSCFCWGGMVGIF